MSSACRLRPSRASAAFPPVEESFETTDDYFRSAPSAEDEEGSVRCICRNGVGQYEVMGLGRLAGSM